MTPDTVTTRIGTLKFVDGVESEVTWADGRDQSDVVVNATR